MGYIVVTGLVGRTVQGCSNNLLVVCERNLGSTQSHEVKRANSSCILQDSFIVPHQISSLEDIFRLAPSMSREKVSRQE
jgi:hypothetical protein